MSGYSVFARYYDKLTANIDYKRRAEYFDKIIKKYTKTKNNILLELACGTGSLSEQLAKLGYDVIGLDSSEEMLNTALEKKYFSGLDIQYLCQDMRDFDMYGTVGAVLCVLDSINHLQSLGDVEKVFRRTALFCETGGIFIFDVNTAHKHRDILADNTFTYETDNVYCVWENTLDTDSLEVKINLEFFELCENGLYSRSSENFSEKIYSHDDISRLLSDTGFEILAQYADDTFETPDSTSQRVIYVAENRTNHKNF